MAFACQDQGLLRVVHWMILPTCSYKSYYGLHAYRHMVWHCCFIFTRRKKCITLFWQFSKKNCIICRMEMEIFWHYVSMIDYVDVLRPVFARWLRSAHVCQLFFAKPDERFSPAISEKLKLGWLCYSLFYRLLIFASVYSRNKIARLLLCNPCYVIHYGLSRCVKRVWNNCGSG